MESISSHKVYGGLQGVYKHESKTTGTEMTFSVFVPDGPGPFAILWYLSGLTCTHANVTEKGEYRAACSKHGIIFIAPDTSPRGENVPNDAAYDMGQGAGFYVDATEAPWSEHFQMRSYIEDELPTLVAKEFPQVDLSRQGICGHSMGGHGALTIGLRNPETYKSVSAFSPIVSPLNCPWGEKALNSYLGDDSAAWRAYDACALISGGARHDHILIDQGLADKFYKLQLKTNLFKTVCADMKMSPTIRLHEGYDHSYYFISTFMSDHVAWHAERLNV